MKKTFCRVQATVFLLIFFQFSASGSQRTIQIKEEKDVEISKKISYLKIGVRLLGGVGFFLGNDINNYLNGRNDYNSEWAKENNALIVEGEYKPIKRTTNIFGEFFLDFTPRIGVGLGIGYHQGSRKSKVFVQDPSYFSEDVEITPRLTSIPIILSVYYGQPVNDWLDIVFSSGISYTFGRVNWDFTSKTVTTVYGFFIESTKSWSAKSDALGFQSQLNFEFKLKPGLSLVFGGGGRYTKLKDLTGVLETEVDTTGYKAKDIKRDATLWYADFVDSGNTYPWLSIWDKEPSGNSWKSVRKARVALTSFGIQVGIKIKLGRFTAK